MKRFFILYLPPAVLVLMITLGVGFAMDRSEMRNLKVQQTSILALRGEALLDTLETSLTHLAGFVRDPAIKQAFTESEPAGHVLMREHLSTLLDRNPIYTCVAWLSGAGWERVRIQQTTQGPLSVPLERLRDLSTDEEVVKALGLQPGQIQLSRLASQGGRGIENGVDPSPEAMVRLTIRLPIVEGRDQGLLRIDLRAQTLLDRLRGGVAPLPGRAPDTLLLNARGDWVRVSPSEGTDPLVFRQETRMVSLQPSEWARVTQESMGQLESASGLWSWVRIDPAARFPGVAYPVEAWILVSHIAASDLRAMRWQRWWPLLLLALSALMMLGIGVYQYRKLLLAKEYGESEAALVNARQLAETELQRSEERLRLATDGAELGIWYWDLAAQTLDWSARCRAQMGIGPEQQPSTTAFYATLHADDRARIKALVEQALERRSDYAAEYRVHWPDGSTHWIGALGRVYTHPDGRPLGMGGITRDISRQKQAEENRRESERRFRDLFEHLPIAYQALDASGRWVDANQRMADLLGFETPGDMLGQRFADFSNVSIRERPGSDDECFIERVGLGGEMQLRRRDGAPLMVLCAERIQRDDQDRFLRAHYILTDITERRAMEDEIRALNADLETRVAERTAEAESASRAKSEFLAHMSHEIRTPMNAVLGLAQLLAREPLAPAQRDMIGRIQTAGQSLLAIIDEILDFSRIESGKLRIESRRFLLEEVLERLERLLGSEARAKDLALRLNLVDAPFGPLLGDALHLEQILVNLVGNAIKFSDRGEVVVSVARVAFEDGRLRLRFEVKDQGIGIAEEALGGLFMPFIQADAGITRRYGGTGLGLSISKRLAELMGGTIGVESRHGQGALFWVELPFDVPAKACLPEPGRILGAGPSHPASTRSGQAPTAESSAAQPGDALVSALLGMQVLAVDDSSLNRDLVARLLRMEGARVTLASDGQQALELLWANPYDFDAVLMDVQMPVMDGRTATSLIRADRVLRGLPIIALTAGVMEEEQRAIREAGADEVLMKPLDLERLVATLRRLVSVRARGHHGAGPAAPALLPAIAGIDASRAAMSACGDRIFYLTQLGLFLEESAGVGEAVRAALSRADRESALRRLHSLKGNAGSLGALELMRAAAAIEAAVREGAANLDTGLSDLDRYIRELGVAAAPWRLPETDEETPTAQTGLEGGVSTLDPLALGALREALRRQDLAALDLFTALKPGLSAFWGREATHALSRALSELRFSEALAQLEQLPAALQASDKASRSFSKEPPV